jgi:hypothetical protein
LLGERGELDAWYRFREQETRTALIRWCEQQGLQLDG